MDFDDDEAPPLLVDLDGHQNQLEEPKPIKVPITIVTGISHEIYYVSVLTANR
jgi:hypothetical protein